MLRLLTISDKFGLPAWYLAIAEYSLQQTCSYVSSLVSSPVFILLLLHRNLRKLHIIRSEIVIIYSLRKSDATIDSVA